MAATNDSTNVDTEKSGLDIDKNTIVSTLGVQQDREVFVIGSRESDLALIQSRHIQDLLQSAFPTKKFVIQSRSTWGDDVQDQPLAALASQCCGLFTKGLEQGLAVGRYDLVVHSLKDMPTVLPNGLTLAGISKREDPRDALVVQAKHKGCGGLGGLPAGSVVGTSSVRRVALIRRKYPHLLTKDVRGNLPTRLKKLDSNGDGGSFGAVKYDALILAVAGLDRMDMSSRIEEKLSLDEFPYGVGQGALGLECRTNDTEVQNMLKAIEDSATARACRAERAFMRCLQGGCQVPIAVFSTATLDESTSNSKNISYYIELTGFVLALDGSTVIKSQSGKVGVCSDADAIAVGSSLGADVIARGANKLLGDILNSSRPLTYSVVATNIISDEDRNSTK